jgi:hypothetical protein
MLDLVPLVKAKVALMVKALVPVAPLVPVALEVKALVQVALLVRALVQVPLVVKGVVQVAPLGLALVLAALVQALDQVRREVLLGEALLVVQDDGSPSNCIMVVS